MIKITKWLFTTINGNAVLFVLIAFLVCALLENL